MEIQFYHLLTTKLEHALPKLVEKAFAGGYRVMIHCQEPLIAQQIDEQLWSFDPDSFLPHALDKADQPDSQPILITSSMQNQNRATLLMVVDGTICESMIDGVERVIDMFNGADEQAVSAARQRWKHYKEAGHTLTYLKQQASGGWKKEA